MVRQGQDGGKADDSQRHMAAEKLAMLNVPNNYAGPDAGPDAAAEAAASTLCTILATLHLKDLENFLF